MERSYQHIFVIGILIILAFLSYLIIMPFLGFMLLGIILAFMCYPVYSFLQKKMRDSYAATITLLAVLLCIIIPAGIIATGLITQANSAYSFLTSHASSSYLGEFMGKLDSWFGIDFAATLFSALSKFESFIVSSIPAIISRAGELAFGMVLMFLVMFYALLDGKEWYNQTISWLPISSSHKKKVHEEVARMTASLFYGQFLVAVLIGVSCGLVFFLFGIPSAIFWGFIMGVFAFIPILGAPIVYVPAGILLMLADKWFAGIGIIVLCSAVIVFFDYVYRQKIINSYTRKDGAAKIHPIIIIVGAVGGVFLMGFVGFVIGPLVLSLLLLFLRLESDAIVKR